MPNDLFKISEPTTAGTGNPTLTFRFILFLVLFCQRYFTANTNDRNCYAFLSLPVIEEGGFDPLFSISIYKRIKKMWVVFLY